MVDAMLCYRNEGKRPDMKSQAIAATIKVGSCTNFFYLARNGKSFAPGEDQLIRLGSEQKILDNLSFRCRMTQADVAILWLLFATFVATAVLNFMRK